MKINDSEVAKLFLNKARQVEEDGRGIKFQLSLGRLLELTKTTEMCEYSGKPVVLNQNLSFERKDPTQDYTDENTILVDRRANEAKGWLDGFVKSTSILNEVKFTLLEQAAGYIRKIQAEANPKQSRAAALLQHIAATQHVIRPDQPLLLDKIYPHGTVVEFFQDKTSLGNFILIKDEATGVVSHGRGQREVTVEYNKLLCMGDGTMHNAQVSIDMATKVVLVHKGGQDE